MPLGVLGHLSRLSGTPSLSLSAGQPVASTGVPGTVSGQRSIPSNTLSPSESEGQPFASTVAPAGVSGHLSMPSQPPSWSESVGQPSLSTSPGRLRLSDWKKATPADPTKCVACWLNVLLVCGV